MSSFYVDPEAEDDPSSIPSAESFYASNPDDLGDFRDTCYNGPGWYYWYCLPGCLPDSQPYGPYATEADAQQACRNASEE